MRMLFLSVCYYSNNIQCSFNVSSLFLSLVMLHVYITVAWLVRGVTVVFVYEYMNFLTLMSAFGTSLV